MPLAFLLRLEGSVRARVPAPRHALPRRGRWPEARWPRPSQGL